MTATPMQCPKCGATMNHHSEKVVYGTNGQIDPDLGGVLEEMHACPRCGYVTSRPAG